MQTRLIRTQRARAAHGISSRNRWIAVSFLKRGSRSRLVSGTGNGNSLFRNEESNAPRHRIPPSFFPRYAYGNLNWSDSAETVMDLAYRVRGNVYRILQVVYWFAPANWFPLRNCNYAGNVYRIIRSSVVGLKTPLGGAESNGNLERDEAPWTPWKLNMWMKYLWSLMYGASRLIGTLAFIRCVEHCSRHELIAFVWNTFVVRRMVRE